MKYEQHRSLARAYRQEAVEHITNVKELARAHEDWRSEFEAYKAANRMANHHSGIAQAIITRRLNRLG